MALDGAAVVSQTLGSVEENESYYQSGSNGPIRTECDMNDCPKRNLLSQKRDNYGPAEPKNIVTLSTIYLRSRSNHR